MNDVFARIGAALTHLLSQSTVNGSQRDEVERLATELQQLETNMDTIVTERVQAASEALEGKLTGYVDQQFADLAASLESRLAATSASAAAAGNDTIVAGSGNDTVSAAGGNDSIVAGGDSTLTGGAGNDSITLNDTIVSGAGNDSIEAGDATLDAGAGNDTIIPPVGEAAATV